MVALCGDSKECAHRWHPYIAATGARPEGEFSIVDITYPMFTNMHGPLYPADAPVLSACRRDMRRDKGFGSALGTGASSVALRALSARGFMTASAPSDWRIPRSALRMQRAMIDGAADATRQAHPTMVAAWQEARLRQALRGRLAITIGHRDILALPPGG